MMGDIWGMDDSNLLVVRTTKAVPIGTSSIDNSGSARGGRQHRRQRQTSRSSTTQSPNSQLPSIGLINNLRSAIDPQSRVEAPRHQAYRPLTLRVDKTSTHARRGGHHCGGVNLSVCGESRRRGPEMIALNVLG